MRDFVGNSERRMLVTFHVCVCDIGGVRKFGRERREEREEEESCLRLCELLALMRVDFSCADSLLLLAVVSCVIPVSVSVVGCAPVMRVLLGLAFDF